MHARARCYLRYRGLLLLMALMLIGGGIPVTYQAAVAQDGGATKVATPSSGGGEFVPAFTEVTGVAWRDTPIFGGRTDTDICIEVFASHGVTDCAPERFFARYVEMVHEIRHEFAAQGTVLPGEERQPAFNPRRQWRPPGWCATALVSSGP